MLPARPVLEEIFGPQLENARLLREAVARFNRQQPPLRGQDNGRHQDHGHQQGREHHRQEQGHHQAEADQRNPPAEGGRVNQ